MLVDYDQGADGRDIFELMESIVEATNAYNTIAADADTAKNEAAQKYARAKTVEEKLEAQKTAIIDDRAVLAAVRERVKNYMDSPTFLKTFADNFGGEFPADVRRSPRN